MGSARRLTPFLVVGLLAVVYFLHSRWLAVPPAVLPEAAIELDQSGSISGRVRDADGPVAQARVRYQGTSEAVLSDEEGRFRLPKQPGTSARVTAWKEGYFIAGVAADASSLTIPLRRLPALDLEEYAWTDPDQNPAQGQNCGNCHQEIHQEWSASGHARSVSNRRFFNLYDGSDWNGRRGIGWNLLAEHPDGAGVCTACHAPTVGFGDPAYYDLRQATGTAARGVQCDFCHKVADVTNEQIGLTHGRFGLKLLRPAKGQLFFGPLDDVDRGEETFASIYGESRYCASCHEGTVFGVHVYGTYSEWLESPARQEGKQCQTCHMAPTGKLTNVAPGKGGIDRDPATLANHTLFSGSQREMLRKCLTLTARLADRDERLCVAIGILANHVGHRVPTGFADRHLLLVLEAFDKDGQAVAPVPGSPALPGIAGNSVAGLAGRLYAKQLMDFDGHSPVPFWRARPETVDTRLAPGPTEMVIYQFGGGVDRVRIRLLYRRFWEELAESKSWPENEIVLVDHILRVKPGEDAVWSSP
jgi:hypothetical protein